MSTRQIAEVTEVSQPQVLSDLGAQGDKDLSPCAPSDGEIETSPNPPKPAVVTGSDSKRYRSQEERERMCRRVGGGAGVGTAFEEIGPEGTWEEFNRAMGRVVPVGTTR